MKKNGSKDIDHHSGKYLGDRKKARDNSHIKWTFIIAGIFILILIILIDAGVI